jgi:hypothetical protein
MTRLRQNRSEPDVPCCGQSVTGLGPLVFEAVALYEGDKGDQSDARPSVCGHDPCRNLKWERLHHVAIRTGTHQRVCRWGRLWDGRCGTFDWLPDHWRITVEAVRTNRAIDVALVQLERGQYLTAPIGSPSNLKVDDSMDAVPS